MKTHELGRSSTTGAAVSETTASDTGRTKVHAAKSAARFEKVKNGRDEDIRGLWKRGDRYYAQLAFEDEATGRKAVRRVALKDEDDNPVATTAQAVAALERLKVNRADNKLPILHRTPYLKDYVVDYLAFLRTQNGEEDMKAAATIDREEYSLNQWVEKIGNVRIDKIDQRHINAFVKDRLDAGRKKRTAELDITVLSNLLHHAVEENWLRDVPKLTRAQRRRLKQASPIRPLFPTADLDALCKAAFEKNEDGSPVTKNAQQFVDYIKLLAYCGGREQETLRLRWKLDVDFEREQLTIGAKGDTKNKTGRQVDFSPNLKAHLQDMYKRRAKDSEWLFPSPQRGDKDIHAKTFRESLKLVRTKAGMENRAFHDCRHHFISMAVMSGIDFMTIAKWVGHRDGGVLVGKTYGHLADSHRKQMAAKMNFGPVVMEKTA